MPLPFSVNATFISPNAFKYYDGSVELSVYRADELLNQTAARGKCVGLGEELPKVARQMVYDVSELYLPHNCAMCMKLSSPVLHFH